MKLIRPLNHPSSNQNQGYYPCLISFWRLVFLEVIQQTTLGWGAAASLDLIYARVFFAPTIPNFWVKPSYQNFFAINDKQGFTFGRTLEFHLTLIAADYPQILTKYFLTTFKPKNFGRE